MKIYNALHILKINKPIAKMKAEKIVRQLTKEMSCQDNLTRGRKLAITISNYISINIYKINRIKQYLKKCNKNSCNKIIS